MGRTIVNLTGQRFGRLTAIESTDQRQGRSVVWKCQCDCGVVKNIKSSNLQTGGTASCGCYRKERTSKD